MPTQIALSWPANPSSEGVQNYKVWESKNDAAYALIATVTTPSHVINAPLPGNYKWKATATNFVGTGPDSAITEGPGVPSAPGAITATITN